MLDSINIRRARLDDVDALTRIRRTAILTLAAKKIGESQAQAWVDSAAPNRIQYAIEAHLVWIATLADQTVGWVEVNDNQIKGIYVQPAQARHGIGSALLTYAEEHIRTAGYVTVTFDASWNAEKFYRHRGYQPRGKRSPEEGLPMVKTFA